MTIHYDFADKRDEANGIPLLCDGEWHPFTVAGKPFIGRPPEGRYDLQVQVNGTQDTKPPAVKGNPREPVALSGIEVRGLRDPSEPDDNGTAFSYIELARRPVPRRWSHSWHIDIDIPEGGGAGAEYRVVSPGKITRQNLLLKFTRQTEVIVK